MARLSALAAMALPAVWQLSGYVMALFLAGLRGIPEDLREAAKMDGAGPWTVYARIIMPNSGPVIATAAIVLSTLAFAATAPLWLAVLLQLGHLGPPAPSG